MKNLSITKQCTLTNNEQTNDSNPSFISQWVDHQRKKYEKIF